MYKKLMLVINPNAGRGGYKNNFAEALRVLDEGGYRTTLYYTSGPGEATELVKYFAKDYDTVACIGGDGTLSEVAAGLAQLDSPPPLGYFPMGTTNDVARTLNLPINDNLSAAMRLLNGKPHSFDIGLFDNNKFFAYIAAFGAFTDIPYVTPQDQKKWLGHLAYVLQGSQQLSKIEPVHTIVEYDGGVVEADLIYGSMSNSTSVAGIMKLPEQLVCLGDGMSELVLVKNPAKLSELPLMLESVISQRFDNENILVLHTTKAKFSFDAPVSWTRDGEDGGRLTHIELSNIPRAVQLIF
jgi:YegS/Rv2252/BmrU family lipid kinase